MAHAVEAACIPSAERAAADGAAGAAAERGSKRTSNWDVGAGGVKAARLASSDAPGGGSAHAGLLPASVLSGAAPSLLDASGQQPGQMGGPPPTVATWVPTERVPDVLGLRGAIVQRIKQLSGATQVHVHEEAGRPVTPVQVAGPPEAAARVGELVQAVLSGRHEAIGFVRQTFELPERLSLACPVGHVLKRVSAASGAWVQQPDASGPLVITGMPETVAQARQLLLEESGAEGRPTGAALPPAVALGARPEQLYAGGAGAGAEEQCGPRRELLLQQLRSHLETAGQQAVGGTSVGAATGVAAAGVGLLAGLPVAGLSAAAGLGSVAGLGALGSLAAPPGPGAGPAAGPATGPVVGPAAGSGAAAAGTGQVLTSHFEIPAQRVKDVLGVRGRNVKALKAQSGIQKINIMDRSDPATVTVTGTASAIETCRFMVLSIVAGDQSVIGNVVEHMEIDQRIVSKFIGPKGQVISQIKDQSGAYLEVRETGGGQPPRIIMTGPPDCVVRARELITQFLTENGAAASVLSMGGGRGVDPYAQYYAQAKLQEAQIHAQLQEAQLQAQLQEVQLQQAQAQAQATAQLQAQLQAQTAAGAFGPDLQALYAHLAQTGAAGSAGSAAPAPHAQLCAGQHPPPARSLPGLLAAPHPQQVQQHIAGQAPSGLAAQPPSLPALAPHLGTATAGQAEAQSLLSALEAIEAQRRGS
mmetsp:Transcript_31887/g.99767  ORF Transcript_31887/g.99767 Transcript_31887/m.99767 type:complete len:700 (+) Transcript_31887:83-2182(+)